jgi:endonuclease/exonuclease/phosphatase (EEP) superfamily protein YafD
MVKRPGPSEVIGVAGWTTLAALFVAAPLRLFAADRSPGLVLLAALTPVLYLPAWLVAAVAAVARRWCLFLAALLVVGVHVWWTAPLFLGARGPLPRATASAKVLALNLNGDRPTGQAAEHVIAAVHPDLVVLSEASPTSTAGIEETAFPVVVSDIEAGTNGWLVLSRWPLLDQRRVTIGDRQIPRLVLRRPDGGRLVLWQVHPVAPTTGHLTEWKQQLEAIRAAISSDDHGSDPAVVAGDFNATRDLPEFAALLNDGWADAGDGHGLLATWRSGGRLPPLLRLDHILVSATVGVRSIRRTAGVGSDHLGLIAVVQFG